MKNIKNLIILSVFALIFIFTFQILTYQKKIHETNKEYFNKTIFQEAQTHFEYFKVFRAWNAQYNGVYVKEQEGIKPNKYLVNNQLFTNEGERLIKINPAWMTKQVSEMMNTLTDYNYKITSLKPMNPDNKAYGFEVEALSEFDKNPDINYYTKLDKENDVFNFMGKLTVKESCLQCHAVQGYEIGQTRGGIRVTIPLEVYEENFEVLNQNYTYQRVLVVGFAIIIFIILFMIINRIYKNQLHVRELKNKYKILYDRYDYAVTGSNLGLWDWNLKTNEVYFSKIWKKMLGFEDEELPSLLESWETRVHPDDKQKAISQIKANQAGETEFYENIHRIKHKDGSWVWILDKGKTIFDEKGQAIRMLGVHADITKIEELKQELKDKEEIMIAQSRHAAMGEMISMIAHQWRQPISVIAMAANNTLADIELEMLDNDELRENTESMLEQTKYLSQTIEDFRDFFRPNKEKEKTTCLRVLEESLKIMEKALENNEIEIIIDETSSIEVMLYSRELLQVYLNIFKNAKEALVHNRKEKREITAKIFTLNDKTLRTTICDNAGGIPENIIDKLFEPYFSTKDEKSGTGLGLYMCKTIVEKHFNGEIGVYNGKEGACFYVDLPINS